MAPIRLSETWYRRFYGAVFVAMLLPVALFVLDTLGITSDRLLPTVDFIGIIITGAVAVAALILAMMPSISLKNTLPGVVLYLAALGGVGYIAAHSGGVQSSFALLWALLALFSPLFGAAGWLTVIAGGGIGLAAAYLESGLSQYELFLTLASSALPLIAGVFLWWSLGAADRGQDTHEIKHLASQLSEVANKSEIVINAIGDGVLAVDGKGIIQLINPAAQQLLGWGKQDALLLNYKSILPLTDENNHELDKTQDPIQQVLNSNQEARGNKLTTATHAGKKVSISIVVSPIGAPGAGAIAVFRDVTKERAEEREQAEFISTASHEMRTPVASIEGYLGLALNPNTAQVDERARSFILKAHESAQHLGRLFQDLLDVSKSEDGRMTQQPKVIDIVQFTQTLTQGLAQKATDKNLRLVFKPTDGGAQRKIMPVYFVNQDNDHIREIIDNLIENAIKYTPEGQVTVDVTGSEDSVVVSIADTGLGIPAEDIPHLFQKFYRVDNADRQSIGGTGLGLYLSRRLAESMQGRLWAESTYGKGSTFYLELPRVESQEAARLKEAQAAQAQSVATANAQSTSPAAPLAPAAPSANPAPASASVMAPTAHPVAAQTQQAPQGAAPVRPATTVPRGESLTREQIAERVRQLEALAAKQRNEPPTRM